MIIDDNFWDAVVNAWVRIETEEETQQTQNTAAAIATAQLTSTSPKVPSLLDDVFGGDD